MKIEVLLVQFLILAFTGLLWWIARRDLTTRSVPPPPSVAPTEIADLEQLCATLETLVTRLSRRLDFVERQLSQEVDKETPPVRHLESTPMSEPARPEQARMEEELARIADGIARMEEGLAVRQSEPVMRQSEPAPAVLSSSLLGMPQEAASAPDPRYAPVYALLDDGVTDPVEIARHTGLGRGEVELILSLRERRAF